MGLSCSVFWPERRTLRETAYRAYISRASSGDTDNGPVIDAIMSLRQEQAHLAGYTNAAAFLMANKVTHFSFLVYSLRG